MSEIKGPVPFKNWHSYHKFGAGLGLVSLGVGSVGLLTGLNSAQAEKRRLATEQKSLTALQNIHKALALRPIDPHA
jgi:hypothetical protein